ncbi:MAG: hypothetical protein H0U44_05605 [Flavisolibacter sp.]|nr:hypothetical protein [Flavisolibacter sp.]
MAKLLTIDFSRIKMLVPAIAGLFLWWSGVFWNYIQRITDRLKPAEKEVAANGENIVNRKTYILHAPDTTEIPFSEWRISGLKSFQRIYMPGPTVDGIERLMNSELVKSKRKISVLNLTELTPLAAEIPYETEKGGEVPLWHHLGVGMFNKEAAVYQDRINNKTYDLVLFEYIPRLNNFFPFKLRDALHEQYKKIDEFPAPRRGDTQGLIEVFVKE